ncbi:MAG: GNAT family N-acetyltransferase [Burkholderiales bacterium]|jgi:ribosomal protein S18 acetylase RimI-like enzyme|nr:GNAT family N-acetyltransferase [Burkholderiales bacterium]
MTIIFHTDTIISVDQFITLLRQTTLGERRPLSDPARIEKMLRQANLTVSAWDGERLIGIARCLTDFDYCCYISDLAVSETYQRQGIGKALIALVQKQLHPEAKIILLAAPQAYDYYGKIGFERHPSAWTIFAKTSLAAPKDK